MAPLRTRWHADYCGRSPSDFTTLHLVRNGVADRLWADDDQAVYVNTYANRAEAEMWAARILDADPEVTNPIPAGYNIELSWTRR